MRSYSINIVLFILLISYRWSVMAMTVITTDLSAMYNVQKSAESIAMSKGTGVDVFAVESDTLTRYLQIGKSGDVLVTSYKQLCEDLSAKGLASSLEVIPIFQEHMYCIRKQGMQHAKHKVFMFIAGEYHPITESTFEAFAKHVNAQVLMLNSNDDIYQVVMENLKNEVDVCGLQSLFANMDINGGLVKNYGLSVTYYACPLIGLRADAYKILLEYYETQHRTKN